MSDIEYPILTEDGKQFCRCRREGTEILLVAKNGTMSLSELATKATNPENFRKSRGKKPNRINKASNA